MYITTKQSGKHDVECAEYLAEAEALSVVQMTHSLNHIFTSVENDEVWSSDHKLSQGRHTPHGTNSLAVAAA